MRFYRVRFPVSHGFEAVLPPATLESAYLMPPADGKPFFRSVFIEDYVVGGMLSQLAVPPLPANTFPLL